MNQMVLPLLLIVLFTMLMLAASLHTLTALGHFPRAARLPAMSTWVGTAAIWLSIAVVAGSVVIGLVAAWRLIPWYAAVIGGGGGILAAPLVLQSFPDRFVDGKRGLVGFAAVTLALALALLWQMRA